MMIGQTALLLVVFITIIHISLFSLSASLSPRLHRHAYRISIFLHDWLNTMIRARVSLVTCEERGREEMFSQLANRDEEKATRRKKTSVVICSRPGSF